MTIVTLMSRDVCYHGYETAFRRISGFFLNKARAWFLSIASARELQYVCACACVHVIVCVYIYLLVHA